MPVDKKKSENWFYIKNVNKVDSPALVVYQERVHENIRLLLSMAGDSKRLRPHVKTFKSKEPVSLMMKAGVDKFKCATIAEAEMLAIAGAKDVLLAYQPSLVKLKRLITLIKKYPLITFSCLVDNLHSAKVISGEAVKNGMVISIYLDLNVGMNRTGIHPNDGAIELYNQCKQLKGLNLKGLHTYDGHIRSKDFKQRLQDCNAAFKPVEKMKKRLSTPGLFEPVIIAGGSPTFPIHAKRKNVECSPGTFIYWDKGYQESCPEQKFVPAALVISRIISLPDNSKICLDLGHKSIAPENDLTRRVFFLNAPELKFISQSEEHLVAEAGSCHSYKVGDVLYGLPFHICPTCALYDRAIIIEKKMAVGEWKTIARDRKITV